MPWRKIKVRKSGRRPKQGLKCDKCSENLKPGEEAFHIRHTHHVKYRCFRCFVSMWV